MTKGHDLRFVQLFFIGYFCVERNHCELKPNALCVFKIVAGIRGEGGGGGNKFIELRFPTTKDGSMLLITVSRPPPPPPSNNLQRFRHCVESILKLATEAF